MNFYFSLKVMKEKKQKTKVSKTTNIAPANNKNQTAETNNYT